MSSVRCHNKMYVQKVERGASIPKCLTSSEKIAGYSLIKLPLHSEMADTNSKAYKPRFLSWLTIYASNLFSLKILKKAVHWERQQIILQIIDAQHSMLNTAEKKISNLVHKERKPHSSPCQNQTSLSRVKRTCPRISSAHCCLQVSTVIVFMSLLKQIMENADPGTALDDGMQLIRPACVAVSFLEVCSTEIIKKNNSASGTSHSLTVLGYLWIDHWLSKDLCRFPQLWREICICMYVHTEVHRHNEQSRKQSQKSSRQPAMWVALHLTLSHS